MFNRRKNKGKNSSIVSSRSINKNEGRYSNNKTISSYRFNQSAQSREPGIDRSKATDKASRSSTVASISKQRLLVFSVILLMVFVVVWQLTLSRSAQITYFQSDSSPYRSTDEYQAKIDDIFSSDIWSMTKLSIDTNTIESRIQEAFPELDGVSVRLPVFGRTPTVTLSVRKPAFVLITKSEGSFLVDDQGLAVSDADSIQSAQKQGLPVVIDQSEMQIDLGQQVITSDTAKFILDTKSQLDAKSISVAKLVLPARANGLDIYPDGVNYFVKTDTSGDARLQIGTYLALMDHFSTKGIRPAEYVDVRVEERAFYK